MSIIKFYQFLHLGDWDIEMVQEETFNSIFYSSSWELFMVAAGVKYYSGYVSI